LILASETLYEPRHAQMLVQALDALLLPDGVAVVASKVLYFGVGGGTDALRRAAQRRWNVATVRRFEDGASNTREVVEVTRTSLCTLRVIISRDAG
jgi:hypothetical protein